MPACAEGQNDLAPASQTDRLGAAPSVHLARITIDRCRPVWRRSHPVSDVRMKADAMPRPISWQLPWLQSIRIWSGPKWQLPMLLSASADVTGRTAISIASAG